jgi:hypothetical protein
MICVGRWMKAISKSYFCLFRDVIAWSFPMLYHSALIFKLPFVMAHNQVILQFLYRADAPSLKVLAYIFCTPSYCCGRYAVGCCLIRHTETVSYLRQSDVAANYLQYAIFIISAVYNKRVCCHLVIVHCSWRLHPAGVTSNLKCHRLLKSFFHHILEDVLFCDK